MKVPKKSLKTGLASAGLLAGAYLLFWPVPIEPASWHPPRDPGFEGPFAVIDRLGGVRRIGAGLCPGPEDLAVDAEGRVHAGLEDGTIARIVPESGRVERWTSTGGRPLGLDFDPEGNLVVADGVKGLLSVDPKGAVTVLSTGHEGERYLFLNDVDVAGDGTIYFTDSSARFGPDRYKEEILDHRPSGRLLAYDPNTRGTRVVASDLYFANGVAVADDGRSVLVAETTRYRVLRSWIRGSRSGEIEVFVENLPGFPDGISTDSEGKHWLALYSPRSLLLDLILPRPSLREILMRLPSVLQPRPNRYGAVVCFDRGAKIIHNLQDPRGGFAPVTSVEAAGGILYLGSLEGSSIGSIPIPAPAPLQDPGGLEMRAEAFELREQHMLHRRILNL